jgi:hypothetical protein
VASPNPRAQKDGTFARETFVVADGSQSNIFAFIIRVLPKYGQRHLCNTIRLHGSCKSYQLRFLFTDQGSRIVFVDPCCKLLSGSHACDDAFTPGSGKQRDSRSDFENEEIGGTRAKGRLFQLTRGQSVQRFKDACSDPERVVSVAEPGIHQQERSLMSNTQQW